jgi:hypothetical protein
MISILYVKKLRIPAPVYETEINDREGYAVLTTRDPFIRKSWHWISPASGGRSVGKVRLRTKGHGVCLLFRRKSVDVSEEYIVSCPPTNLSYLDSSVETVIKGP